MEEAYRSELLTEAKKTILHKIRNRQCNKTLIILFLIIVVYILMTIFFFDGSDLEKISRVLITIPVTVVLMSLLVIFSIYFLPYRPKYSKEDLDKVFQEIVLKRKQEYADRIESLEKKLETEREKYAKIT